MSSWCIIKTIISFIPSKFKSISENCPAFIPPEKVELKYMPFSFIFSVSHIVIYYQKIIANDFGVEW